MSATPFFSVIIPTRGRAHMVGDAITSVLRQTFQDFELVIIDNDTSDATATALQRFDDPRLRCLRTGDLSMPDNWEYGFTQARGNYLTVLPDRSLFLGSALAYIHETITRHPDIPALSWNVSLFVDDLDAGDFFFTHQPPRQELQLQTFSADALLAEFLTAPYYAGSMQHLPKGLNSVISRSLFDTIRRGPLERLCAPYSPDYTMAFQQIAYSDTILHLEAPISLARRSGGNGHAIRHKMNTPAVQKFIQDFQGETHFFSHVPAKYTSAQNALFNDYVRLRPIVGGNLARHPLDMVDYYTLCYHEIIRNKGEGIHMATEENGWQAALAQEPEALQNAVRARVGSAGWQAQARVVRRNATRRWVMPALRRYRKGRRSPVFTDVLAALAWLEQQVTP